MDKANPETVMSNKTQAIFSAEKLAFKVMHKKTIHTSVVKKINYLLRKKKTFYLTKDISQLLITNSLDAEIQQFVNFQDQSFIHLHRSQVSKYQELYCYINFENIGHPDEMKNQIKDDQFYKYLKRMQNDQCILSNLKNIYNVLDSNGKAVILTRYPINKEKIKQYLQCANFENIEFEQSQITATPRKQIRYFFHHDKYLFKEVTDLDGIFKIMDHAYRIFKNQNYNHCLDSLFIPNSTYYCCEHSDSEEIINFMRITWALPGYHAPYMLANTLSQNDFRIQAKDKLCGEIFAPLSPSRMAYRCYKELVLNILNYCLTFSFDNVFTTCSTKDFDSKRVFVDTFGFQDTLCELKYGDFEGTWNLLTGCPEAMRQILYQKVFKGKMTC